MSQSEGRTTTASDDGCFSDACYIGRDLRRALLKKPPDTLGAHDEHDGDDRPAFDLIFEFALPSAADRRKDGSEDRRKRDTAALRRALAPYRRRLPAAQQGSSYDDSVGNAHSPSAAQSSSSSQRRPPSRWSCCPCRAQSGPQDMSAEVREVLLSSAKTPPVYNKIKALLNKTTASGAIATAAVVRRLCLDIFLELLRCEGFVIKCYASADRRDVLVCASAPDEALLRCARLQNYRLQMDKKQVQYVLGIPWLPKGSTPAYVPYHTSYQKYLKLYPKVDHEHPSDACVLAHSVLRPVDRIRLCQGLILKLVHLEDWSSTLLCLKSYFPLHCRQTIERFGWTWANPFGRKHKKLVARNRADKALENANIPEGSCCGCCRRLRIWRSEYRQQLTYKKQLEEVRNYFGERIAFYFAFLHHTVYYLKLLSALAVLITVFEVLRPDVGARDCERPYLELPGCYWQNLRALSLKELGLRACSNAENILLGMDWSDPARIIFGATTSIWAAVFVRMWIRQEAFLANEWGTDMQSMSGTLRINQKAQAHRAMEVRELPKARAGRSKIARAATVPAPMPDAEPEVVVKIVEGAQSVWQERFEVWRNTLVRFITWLLTFCFVGLELYTTSIIMTRRSYHMRQDERIQARLMSLCLSLQMQLYTNLWPYVAAWLTEWERNYFLASYTGSHAIKVFLIDFVAAFAAQFYTAFFQEFREAHHADPKQYYMEILVFNVEVVFGVYILCALLDILIPFISLKCRLIGDARLEAKRSRKEIQAEISYLECQSKFDTYTGDYETYDYEQIILPLAFVMLFGLTMPLATVLALWIVQLQQKADAWKLVNAYKRPYPAATAGIGIWRVNLLIFLAFGSGFVNLGLVIFRLRAFRGAAENDVSHLTRQEMITFVIGEHVLIAAIVVVMMFIPRLPRWVQEERLRQRFQFQRLRADMVESIAKQFLHEDDVRQSRPSMERRQTWVSSLHPKTEAHTEVTFRDFFGKEHRHFDEVPQLTPKSPYFELPPLLETGDMHDIDSAVV